MKKVTFIFLVLMVGIFLASGALAGDFMVVYIHVESGAIGGVYGADAIPTDQMIDQGRVRLQRSVIHTENGQANGNRRPIPPKLTEQCYNTFYAESSPGCRYIKHPACYYVKVCN